MVVTSTPFPIGAVGIAPGGTGMAGGIEKIEVLGLPALLGVCDGGAELDEAEAVDTELDDGALLGGVLEGVRDEPGVPEVDAGVLVGMLEAPASYLGYPNAPASPATSTPTTPNATAPTTANRVFRILQRPFPHGNGVVPSAFRLQSDAAYRVFDKHP